VDLCSYGVKTIAGAYYNIIRYVHRDMIILLWRYCVSNIRVRRYDKCVSELRRLRSLLLLLLLIFFFFYRSLFTNPTRKTLPAPLVTVVCAVSWSHISLLRAWNLFRHSKLNFSENTFSKVQLRAHYTVYNTVFYAVDILFVAIYDQQKNNILLLRGLCYSLKIYVIIVFKKRDFEYIATAVGLCVRTLRHSTPLLIIILY